VTTILLARHGETDWNAQRRVQGHSDTPLNDNGRAQALALAETLEDAELDAVYASDLMRARDTAEVVAGRKGIEVTVLPELRERHFGTWEGLTDTEIFERFPDARSGSWGDGETKEEMRGRVLAALHRIADEHPGGRVLVVTHGGPVRSLLLECGLDGRGPIGNCSLYEVRLQDGRFVGTG
jgi:2,3-bisphosphoglycerate-dependent phosphoglycerate mutase